MELLRPCLGCRFADRCRARVVNNLSICEQEEPDLMKVDEEHVVRCWLYDEKYRPEGDIDFGYGEAELEVKK